MITILLIILILLAVIALSEDQRHSLFWGILIIVTFPLWGLGLLAMDDKKTQDEKKD